MDQKEIRTKQRDKLNEMSIEQKEIDWDEPHLMVEELRQEAIKWIKEDMYHYEKDGFVSVVDMKQIARWMKRLDITEGDLE